MLYSRWVDITPMDMEERLQSEAVAAQEPLSERETDVLAYLARGMSNKEIAAMLRIRSQTVKNHVSSILRKLGVEDRAQARLVALCQGRAHPIKIIRSNRSERS